MNAVNTTDVRNHREDRRRNTIEAPESFGLTMPVVRPAC